VPENTAIALDWRGFTSISASFETRTQARAPSDSAALLLPLCTHCHHASAEFTGHNGKVADFKPLLAVSCGKHGKKGKHHHKRASLRRLRMAG
jgi:hypothetical protein